MNPTPSRPADAARDLRRQTAVTSRQRAWAATVATTAVLGALGACSADSRPKANDSPQVAAAAKAYMAAWMVKPSQPKAMCALETTAARPNFGKDGGTLAGCIAAYQDYFKDQKPDTKQLTIRVSHVQDVPASGTRPAGKGALATLTRAGSEPFRYVLRLVKEDGRWRIAQSADVDSSRYAHTADPVADVLRRMT
jgi:hypothetical protein